MTERVQWDYMVVAEHRVRLQGAEVLPEGGGSPYQVFEFAGDLRKLGEDGWELASTIETTEQDKVLFVLKRPGIEYDLQD